MSTIWFSHWAQWKKRLGIGVFLIFSGIFYVKIISPVFHIHIPCIFHKTTGLYCPGCGITRAFIALLNGELYQSFRYNMLIYMLAPLYVMYSVLLAKRYTKHSQILIWMMLIFTIGFGILRNISLFSELAPITI